MKAKHTPGPWRWSEPSNWHGLAALVTSDKHEPIAQVHMRGWPKRTAIANARLIAAATDLLEACEAALADGPHNASHGLSFQVVDALRAAIAKAKGE